MFLKIELENAFIRLKWSFIYRALRYFTFQPRIAKLIMSCISTSTISILVNGYKIKFFSPCRGIRPRDHMSLYIFIRCMEMLSRYISHQVDLRNWVPINLNNRSPSLSHLFLGDDLTLMEKINTRTSDTILSCLNLFCELSSHKINYFK